MTTTLEGPQANAATRVKRPSRRMLRPRRQFVRVHRWVSLALGIWICLMGLTGLLLTQRDRIEYYLHHHRFDATPGADIGPARAIETIAEAFPGHELHGVNLPPQNNGVYSMYHHPFEDDEHYFLTYVDPGSGRINGTLDYRTDFMQHIVYRLHYDLMQSSILGIKGEHFVGYLAAIWLVVFSTGIYIWYWPRIRQRWTDGVRVRRDRGRFTFNFDLHRAVGIVLVVPLVVVTLTGIGFEFYDPLQNFWEDVTPASDEHIYEPDPELVKSKATAGEPLTADQAVPLVAAAVPGGVVTYIEVPRPDSEGKVDQEGSILAYVSSGFDVYRGPYPGGNVQVNLDRRSGEVLYVGRPDDFNIATQLWDNYLWGLHIGSWAATAGRWAWMGVAVAPIVLFVTGLTMWLVRKAKRRKRQSGAGPRGDDESDGDDELVAAVASE